MSKKDDDTADMITQFSEDLSVILETFIEETQDAKIIISRMETEIGRLKEDIGLLNRTIRDGNGQKPMLTRITILEERIREVKEGIEEIEGEQEAEKKMRWEFLLASIPGIIALVATLLP
jgi:predicted RNase H-like nuclease (RuvC/YqgF family)